MAYAAAVHACMAYAAANPRCTEQTTRQITQALIGR